MVSYWGVTGSVLSLGRYIPYLVYRDVEVVGRPGVLTPVRLAVLLSSLPLGV